MKFSQLFITASILGLAACGGSSDPAPTPPVGNTQTLATIRITNSALALAAGSTATLVPEALDAAGRVIAGVTGYTFTSSAAGVAEAQTDGAVLAIGAGTATITASVARNGVTATATATVSVTGSLPATATVVAAPDRTFAPANLVVARNASVTFSFGTLLHNVVFRTAAGAPTDIPNNASATVVRPFPSAGDFTYDCSLHAGMTGKVTVR
jgi:plastocyanin